MGVDFPVVWDIADLVSVLAFGGSLVRAYGIYISSKPIGSGYDPPFNLGIIPQQTLDNLVTATTQLAHDAHELGFSPSEPGSKLRPTRTLFGTIPIVGMTVGLGYDVFQRNSNTFIGTIARKAGLYIPPQPTAAAFGFSSTFDDWTLSDLTLQYLIAWSLRGR